MDASPRFWDRIARRYARLQVPDEAAYRHKLAETRARLTPEMEVLEIGCGTGSTALAHAPHVRRILALDISENMIAIARDRAVEAGAENVTFRRTGIGAFEAPPASYDAVLALNLLHLVEDRDALLRHIHDWLRPGGMLVSSTICIGDFMGWFRYVGPLGYRLRLLPMVRVFTEAELDRSLSAAGFETECRWQPKPRRPVFLISRKAG